MANPEDSSPLLGPDTDTDTDTKTHHDDLIPNVPPPTKAEPSSPPPKQLPPPPPEQPHVAETYAWTADGLPLGVVGHPMMGRAQWSSDLCSCLGRNDDFCSSDLEVCLLGTVAPCVLYGSNVERLGSTPGSFSNHCMAYTALYLIGNSFFGWNCLAPWFSYTNRTAVRRRFNLEGTCESLAGHYGCCGSCVKDDVQREQCETACDFATHVFCHPCSLCQEGREIRRRLPHPGFNAQPALFMIPPGEQTMGRDQM